VLMLTARGEMETKLKTFGIGADDYLTKPFDFRELLARIQALLRRGSDVKSRIIKIEDLEIDTNKFIVKRGSQVLDLTKRNIKFFSILR